MITFSLDFFNFRDSIEITIKKGEISYPNVSYDFSNFLKTYKGTLLFFSANKKRFYKMDKSSLNQGRLEFFKNLHYRIYFVPEDIDKRIVKFTSQRIINEKDIQNILALLKPVPADVIFTDWKLCLGKFEEAKISDDKLNHQINTIKALKWIMASNGFLHLLLHLRDIIENDENKKIFKELLDYTIENYNNLESPFKIIDLIQANIPGFSVSLKERLLSLGVPRKVRVIIQLLSNPLSNLTELRHYINGDLNLVNKQNQKYFKDLEY